MAEPLHHDATRLPAGSKAPHSGIYRVYHYQHRMPHSVIILKDDELPMPLLWRTRAVRRTDGWRPARLGLRLQSGNERPRGEPGRGGRLIATTLFLFCLSLLLGWMSFSYKRRTV